MQRNKTVGKQIIAELLLNSETWNNIKLDEGYTIFKTIWNTPAYFDSKKKDLLAMVCQVGLPTLFYLLSAADTYWTPLIQCLGRIVDKKAYDEKYIAEEMPTKDK